MGRYYRGDIEGKLGFGTQPSDTFKQFGGIVPSVKFAFAGLRSDDNPYGFNKERLLELVDSYNSKIENWKCGYEDFNPESLSKEEQDILKLSPIKDINKIIKEDNWQQSFKVDIMWPYIDCLTNNSNASNKDIRLIEDIFLGLKIYKQVLINIDCEIEVEL